MHSEELMRDEIWFENMLQGVDLEGVARGRQGARTVDFPPCGGGGHQARDVADVPDRLRALSRRQVDVIQRKASSRRTCPTDALKNHASLVSHVQSDGVQLPPCGKNTPSSTTRFFLPLHTGPVSTFDPPKECSSAALGLVGLSNPDVEDIVERSAPVKEELETLGTRFGVNPLSFQRRSVRRVGGGGAEVHEVAFS